MPNLNESARRIREDAEHAGYKLGAKSTMRLIATIEAMAADLEELKAGARSARSAARAAACA